MEENLLEIKGKPKNVVPIIKVIGVGGGGGNAVNHMYGDNIKDVTFLLCNTDRQHLYTCNVPETICIGEKITNGLGAGNKPEKARQAAEESRGEIEAALSDETRMVFITAGMGGGTGTGAAPVIAGIAKGMGILTVGIVTIPFLFEGRKKILQALKGVEEMSKNVDALLVIRNELLHKIYSNLKVTEAFRHADEILTVATRSISELVTLPGRVNLDFADVHSTLFNGGVAIISRGFGTGEDSINEAIHNALTSPLLNTTDIEKATKVLINVSFSKESEPEAEKLKELDNFTSKIGGRFEFIWGYSTDESLGDKLCVTILASGLNVDDTLNSNEEIYNVAIDTADEDKVINKYYGRAEKGVFSSFRSETPVIFTDDELDNDTFIAYIASTPTLKRTMSMVERLRKGQYGGETDDGQSASVVTTAQENSTYAPEENETTPEPTFNSKQLELEDELFTFGKK